MAPSVLSMKTKHCKYCNTTKELSAFHKSPHEKLGVRNKCKVCVKEYNNTRYQSKRDELLEWQSNYYEANKEERRAYGREQAKTYYQNNKAYFYNKTAQRRAVTKQATPEWANLQYIEDLYSNVAEANEVFKDIGVKFHIDHIVPLNNPLVCGLHNEYNLQILTAEENLSKSNKYDPIKTDIGV